MLVFKCRYVGHGGQVLADKLSKDAVALTVEDANTGHTHENGIVDEMHHGIKCLVATLTPDIQILVEMALAFVDGLPRLFAYGVLFGLLFLRLCGQFV